MEDLSNAKVVKKIISENGFKFSKSLGQNFIIDPFVCPQMAESCAESDGIIEVGPGIGTLTAELAKRFKKVVSVELDKRLIPILKENLKDFPNSEIIYGDILKTDLSKIIKENLSGCEKVSVCANLPYYITSEVIMHILESEFKIDSIVVMVQKEAAERICAEPGTRKSGAISLAVRYFGKPEILFDVNKTCFMPVPAVDSSVIRIKIGSENRKDIKNKRSFFKIVKAAFSQRRKNILNSLSSGLKMTKNEVENLLASAEIAQNLRAENLKLDDFVKLSNELDLILK